MEFESVETGEPAFDAEPLLAAVREVLDEKEYRYREHDGRTLTFTLRNGGGLYSMAFTTYSEADTVHLIASYGSSVPTAQRRAVAELLSRANRQIALGAFALDFSDGEVTFHYSTELEGSWLSGKMIENMIDRAMYTMERFHQAIMSVAFGDMEPELAMSIL